MLRLRKTIARLTIGVLTLVGLVAVASPAYAAKARQGSIPATCDAEDSGRIVQVPEGTRYGLFYCGSDGEWHFGTVQLDWRTAEPTSPPVKPSLVSKTATVAVSR